MPPIAKRKNKVVIDIRCPYAKCRKATSGLVEIIDRKDTKELEGIDTCPHCGGGIRLSAGTEEEHGVRAFHWEKARKAKGKAKVIEVIEEAPDGSPVPSSIPPSPTPKPKKAPKTPPQEAPSTPPTPPPPPALRISRVGSLEVGTLFRGFHRERDQEGAWKIIPGRLGVVRKVFPGAVSVEWLEERKSETISPQTEVQWGTEVKEPEKAPRIDPETGEKKEGPGIGVRYSLFGHPITAIFRWMGKQGWSAEEAIGAAKKLGIECSPSTAKIQVRAGADPKMPRGEPAELTGEQVKELEAARK